MKTNLRPDNHPVNLPFRSLISSSFMAERSFTPFFIKAASIVALAMDRGISDTVSRILGIRITSGPLTKNRFWLATETVIPLTARPCPNKLALASEVLRYMRHTAPILWAPNSPSLPTTLAIATHNS